MEQEVIGARFLNGTKTYYFNPKGNKYKLGEKVVVNTKNGLDVAVIVKENFVTNTDKIPELQDVERPVNANDLNILKKTRRTL